MLVSLLFIGINFVIIWTVVSNLTVMLLISVYKKLRQPRNFLIFSLAATDLLVGVVVMPVMIFVEPKIPGNWTYGIIACDLYWVITITVIHVSIYHLVMIALDCYLSLKNAFYSHQRTYTKILIMILVAWSAGGLPSLLLLSFQNEEYATRITKQKVCYFSLDRSYIWVTTGFGFWLSSIIICTLYFKIYKLVTKITKRGEIFKISDAMKSKTNSEIEKAKRRKTIFTLSLITGTFIICWTPFFFILCFLPQYIKTVVCDVFHWSGILNSSLNPILYTLFAKNIQTEAIAFIRCLVNSIFKKFIII